MGEEIPFQEGRRSFLFREVPKALAAVAMLGVSGSLNKALARTEKGQLDGEDLKRRVNGYLETLSEAELTDVAAHFTEENEKNFDALSTALVEQTYHMIHDRRITQRDLFETGNHYQAFLDGVTASLEGKILGYGREGDPLCGIVQKLVRALFVHNGF